MTEIFHLLARQIELFNWTDLRYEDLLDVLLVLDDLVLDEELVAVLLGLDLGLDDLRGHLLLHQPQLLVARQDQRLVLGLGSGALADLHEEKYFKSVENI